MTKLELIRKLIDFRNKGACFYTQHRASKIKHDLKCVLSEGDYWSLSLAHAHYVSGEGRIELDQVVNDLIRKYS